MKKTLTMFGAGGGGPAIPTAAPRCYPPRVDIPAALCYTDEKSASGMTRKGRVPMCAKQNRNGAIDRIKTIAILSVLTIHSFTSCFRSPLGTWDWYGGLLISAAARAAVPLFFMCTGALMLRPERDLSLRRLFTRYIPRLLAALFFWAFVYKVYDRWETGYTTGVKALTAANLWFDFKTLFFFKHESHFYYVHMVLLFYVMIPVLRLFVKSADRKLLRYALAVWFVTGIVLPTARPYYPYNHFSGIPLQ